MKNKIEFPCIFDLEENIVSWDQWLSFTEKKLSELGFKKYFENHYGEDFIYWRTIEDIDSKKLYMNGILFYDFRKHIINTVDNSSHRISLMFETLILTDSRIDMLVSKDITLNIFEEMAEDFYETMNKYNKN